MSKDATASQRPASETTGKWTPLDLAWANINALGGASEPGDIEARGYVGAIRDALKALEDLGATTAAWDAGQ